MALHTPVAKDMQDYQRIMMRDILRQRESSDGIQSLKMKPSPKIKELRRPGEAIYIPRRNRSRRP